MDGVQVAVGSRWRARPILGRGVVRRVAVSVLAAVAVGTGAGTTIAPARAAVRDGALPNRAAVVVEVDGIVHTAKVSFTDDSISGLDALRSAGFDPSVRVFGANGGAVCALRVGSETIGCPADGSCLTCAAPDYWAYFRAVAGATTYTYSLTGAGNTKVHDGDVEAWAWGTGSPPSPFVSFRDVWGPDAPPTTGRPPTTPPTSAPRPPPSTPPSTVRALESPTTASTSTARSLPEPPTTVKRPTTSATRAEPSTTTPITTGRATSAGRERRVATAPVVARGGGGSPYGLIGFAAMLAALLTAIVFARRRRSARSQLRA
jgi:hypothetical protein